MKLYGSLSRLVSILFRKDSQDITLRPNQATTYTAARDIQLPAGDAAHELAGTAAAQTLTNKTIDADSNTISNIADAEIAASAAIAVSKLAALTASRATVSDGSGFLAASATTSTELGYVSGVTSSIQDQLDDKQADVITTEGDVIVGSAGGAVARLALGTNGQVLTSNGTTALWADAGSDFSSFAADWIVGDGATKVVTHSLDSKDVQVEIYDTVSDETVWIDSIVRTTSDSVTLTSSEIPPNTWRVTIHAL